MTDDSISFRLKDIQGLNWQDLNQNSKEKILKRITDFPLLDESPKRYGFVKCKKINDDCIYGYFTKELVVERHKYDISKNENVYIDTPFEDVFFVILFDFRLCLIQKRRFENSSINMSLIYDNFKTSLKNIFEEFGVTIIGLKDVTKCVKKEEFISIFRQKNITSLKVGSLKGLTVPEDLVIFNPHFDKNALTKVILNDDFNYIEEISIESPKEGGIQNSKIAKAVLETGDPKEMEFFEGNRRNKRIVKNKLGPNVKLNIDVDSPNEEEISEELNKYFYPLKGEYVNKVSVVQQKLGKWL